MKEGWEFKKIGDIGKVSMCKRILKKQTSSEGDIPFYKIGTFGKTPNAYIDKAIYQEFKEKYSFPNKGDVLISASGTIGRRVVYDGEPAYFQDSNIVWVANDKTRVSNEYLYTFYGYCDWNPSKGATISRLYNDDLRSIKIPVPPISEQKQIVVILDKAFAAIDQAKANIEKNIENGKELFQSKLNEIFSQKGDGWEEKTLGELGTLTSSKRIFKKEYVSDGVPFYRSKEIKELGNNREISLELFITEERYSEIKEKFDIPKKGDILLTAVGTIGEMYVVKEGDKFYFKDGNIMWLKNFTSLNTYYLKYALTCFVEQLKAMSQGSAYSALTIEKLKKYSISVPSISEQEVIVDQLDGILNYQRQVEVRYKKKLDSLKELKKSILQKAFAGELTNKTVEV